MYMQNRNRLTDLENKLTVTKGERERGKGQIRGMRLIRTTMYKIISSKDILYSTGNYSHYLVITYNGV